MSFKETIENQKYIETQDGKFTAYVKLDGKEQKIRAELNTNVPEIKLHFLRLGMFKAKPDFYKDYAYTGRSSSKLNFEYAVTFNGIKNFSHQIHSEYLKNYDKVRIVRTSINKGFVYLINKEDKNDHHEFEVNEFGYIRAIKVKDNLKKDGNLKDIRKANEKDGFKDHIPLKYDEKNVKTYWVCYSPCQWSAKMYTDILNTNDEEKRDMLMREVVCKPFKRNQKLTTEQRNVSHYDELVLALKRDTYGKEHPSKDKGSGDYDFLVKDNYNYHKLKDIHEYETDRCNEDLKDIFVSLEDPIGVGDDLHALLNKEIVDLKILTDAIVSGKSEDECRENYFKNFKGSYVKKTEEQVKEYHELFTLALTSYKHVFSRYDITQKFSGGQKVGGWWSDKDNHYPHIPETSVKYEEHWLLGGYYEKFNEKRRLQRGLHRTKVEAILGVEPRYKLRVSIQKYRKLLWRFLNSPYAKIGYRFFTNNNDTEAFMCTAWYLEKITKLYVRPTDIDKALLLPESVKDLERDVIISYDKIKEGINKLVKASIDKKVKDKLKTEVDQKQKEIDKDISTKQEVDPIDVFWHNEFPIPQKLFNYRVDLVNKLGSFVNSTSAIFSINEKLIKEINEQYNDIKTKKIGGKTKHFRILEKSREVVYNNLSRVQVEVPENYRTKSGKKKLSPFKYYKDKNIIALDAVNLGVIAENPNLKIQITYYENGVKKTDFIRASELELEKVKGTKGSYKGKVGDKLGEMKKFDYNKLNRTNKRIGRINKYLGVLYSEDVTKLLESKGFKTTIVGLQIINVWGAWDQVFEKEKYEGDFTFNTINLLGITTELTEVLIRLFYSRKKVLIGSLGAVADFATAVVCSREAFKSFSAGDEDAGMAWAVAASSFAVGATFGTLILVSGVTSVKTTGWFGPVVTACTFVGLVGVGFAIALKDSKLEYYYKNFLLSDQKAFNFSATNPINYSYALLDENKTKGLVDTDSKFNNNYLRYPKDALAVFHDYITCNYVKVALPNNDIYHNFTQLIDQLFVKSYAFNISIAFSQYLINVDQLEFKGILLNSSKDTPFSLFLSKELNEGFELRVSNRKIRIDKETKMTIFEAFIEIPGKYRYLASNSKFMILSRLKMYKSESYFPLDSSTSSERYMGLVMQAYNSITITGGPNDIRPTSFVGEDNIKRAKKEFYRDKSKYTLEEILFGTKQELIKKIADEK